MAFRVGALMAAGVAVLLSAAVSAANTWQLESDGIATTGTIVSYEREEAERTSSRGDKTQTREHVVYFHKVVQFTGSGGLRHRFRNELGERAPSMQVGEQVPVIYLANDPEHARVDDASVWTTSLVFAVVGLALMALGVAQWLRKTPAAHPPTRRQARSAR